MVFSFSDPGDYARVLFCIFRALEDDFIPDTGLYIILSEDSSCSAFHQFCSCIHLVKAAYTSDDRAFVFHECHTPDENCLAGTAFRPGCREFKNILLIPKNDQDNESPSIPKLLRA